MMRTLTIIVILAGVNLSSQEYVPGTPGALWTQEEALIVKAKLYAIFHKHGGHYALKQMYDDYKMDFQSVDVPDVAKVLRLGFHGCLKYQDGSGGCNGCLNWDGVGKRVQEKFFQFHLPNATNTNNNGLGYTVELLERIYEGNLVIY